MKYNSIGKMVEEMASELALQDGREEKGERASQQWRQHIKDTEMGMHSSLCECKSDSFWMECGNRQGKQTEIMLEKELGIWYGLCRKGNK